MSVSVRCLSVFDAPSSWISASQLREEMVVLAVVVDSLDCTVMVALGWACVVVVSIVCGVRVCGCVFCFRFVTLDEIGAHPLYFSSFCLRWYWKTGTCDGNGNGNGNDHDSQNLTNHIHIHRPIHRDTLPLKVTLH
jgi:hypothetical protein